MHARISGDWKMCVCERGRKGASKQLMVWCSLFFFPLALGQGYIYICTRKRASSYAAYFHCWVA